MSETAPVPTSQNQIVGQLCCRHCGREVPIVMIDIGRLANSRNRPACCGKVMEFQFAPSEVEQPRW